tara:strand:- start:535 stop:2820 length:2286 start_codon:yes stop_codon:yes gene_type:complete
MHPHRWDRSNPSTPMIEEESISVAEWKKDNPHTLKLPMAFIDAETWRDFDRPVFFGAVIIDKYGGLDDAVVGAEFTGELDPATGKKVFKETPKRWGWQRCSKHLKCKNKGRMEACDQCERVKPKRYGKMTSKVDEDERRIRITRLWCWSDELESVLIPALMERGVKVAYAHNSTVDIIALLSQLEPELHHPLQMFVQTDPKEKKPILFRGSKILNCKLDVAPYYNREFKTVYKIKRYNYKEKKFEIAEDYPIEIKDSLAVLPLSLGEIGKAVNFPKGETPNKFKDSTDPDFNDFKSITAADIDYCIQDCEVLFRGMSMMWNTVKKLGYHGSTLPLTSGTLGAQMMARANSDSEHKPKLYKKKKKSYKYQTVVNQKELDDVCRLSMVGGRTQVFNDQPVTGEVYGIDANSHYPSVMTDEANTWPDFRNMNGVDDTNFQIDDTIEGCVYVHWVKPETDQLGLLTARNQDGLLDWTLSEGTRWITIPEYRFALTQGYELELQLDEATGYAAVIMERLPYNPFELINSWYEERLRMKGNNDPSEFAIKILLNAGGFGKFVERNKDMMITTEESWVFMEDGWDFTSVSGDEAVQYGYAQKNEFKRADTTANIMGAYITAYARLGLWKVGTQIGFEHLIYSDTDSWKHTNKEVLCPLAGDNLGQWKLENIYSYWESVRPKQYKYLATWDEKKGTVSQWGARVKGCSLSMAADELGVSFEEFCEGLDLHGIIDFEGVVGLKESWRSKEKRAGQWTKRSKSIGKKKVKQ